MTRKCLAVLALITLFVSVASAQDAKTVIANATKAMGYDGLNTIEFSGPISHEGAGLGQWMSPTKGWHQNTVENFSRFIDFAAGTSQRTGTRSRPGDPATGLLPGGGGLDPSGATTQDTATVGATGAWAARLDVTLSPPMFLKLAAAAPNATARNQSVNGRRYTAVSFPTDQKAPSGVAYALTGYFNNQNMLEMVETAYEDSAPYIFGDIAVVQSYSDYKDFGGVKFPTKITQTRAGVPWSDATIVDVKPNAPAPPAPEAAAGGGRGGRGAAGGGRGGAGARGGGGRGGAGGARGGGGRGAATPAGPREIADGVFVITSGYRVMAIEFNDHVVMVEAPQNNIADMIAQAKMAIPNKPITHIITTHVHFDHFGGVRTVLAEGRDPVTLVTNEMNKDVLEKWFSNPRTLQAATAQDAAAPWPDALQQSGKKVNFQYVKDKLVLQDNTRTVEIYALKGALHGEDMVVVYLPKEKLVFQSDAYNPGAPGAVTTGSGQLAFQKLLASELDRLKLDYTTVISGHPPGDQRDASKQDLMVAIGRVPPPAQ